MVAYSFTNIYNTSSVNNNGAYRTAFSNITYMTLPDYKQWLTTAMLPDSIELQQGVKVLNVASFVHSHIEFLEANTGNKRYLPYWERLLILKSKLT